MVVQRAVHSTSGSLWVEVTGPPCGARRIDGAAVGHQAVGVGGPEDRAVVVVAEGERVGDRVVEGQVLPGVVAHRHHAVRAPSLPGEVWTLTNESMAPRFQHECIGPHEWVRSTVQSSPAGTSRWNGSRVARGAGRRRPGRPARRPRASPPGGRRSRGPVVRAEVVVIGAVLHHQVDDVLDRPEVRAMRCDRRGLLHDGARGSRRQGERAVG